MSRIYNINIPVEGAAVRFTGSDASLRAVVDAVHDTCPGYVIKVSDRDPRNPVLTVTPPFGPRLTLRKGDWLLAHMEGFSAVPAKVFGSLFRVSRRIA